MEIEQLPELDRPNLIASFQGWNDAGQAATTAAYPKTSIAVDAWPLGKP
jgi:hypothetical protein